MPNLLLFHIGPVQGFIASARRSRDLWFGSQLLSELSKTAARAIAERHDVESLVFPAPKDLDELAPGSELSVANKILAYVKGDLDDTPQQVEQAVRKRLGEIAGAAFDLVANRGGAAYLDRANAEAQVRDLPEIYWVSLPCAGDAAYYDDRAYLEALMSVRKNTRAFSQPGAWAAARPKSSLDGLRESVIDEELFARAARSGDAGTLPTQQLYNYFRARRAERLSGIDLMKRLGNTAQAETFPSTSHIAALPAIKQLEKSAQENSRIIDYAKTYAITLKTYLSAETVQPLAGQFAIEALANHDGSILYESRLREDEYLTDEHFSDLQRARRQFLDDALGRGSEPSPYYMVMQGDGDRMGSVINAQKTPADHRRFSQSLSRFAAVAKAIVRAFDGALVYAGGDDVLAFLPLDAGVACAATIAEAFRRLMKNFADADGNHPTFSAGLVIAHHLESLSQTMHLARNAEKAAKAVEGKDTLAITLSKRSGADRTIAGHWQTLTPQFDQMIDLILKDNIPAGAAYDLHSLAVRLDVAVDERFLGIQEQEVKRILERKRSQHGLSPLQKQRLKDNAEAEGKTTVVDHLLAHLLPLQETNADKMDRVKMDKVRQFADALVIADLLADAQILSGRTPTMLTAIGAAELDRIGAGLDAAQPHGGEQ